MRKFLVAVCAGIFLIAVTPFLIASEMDKGSAADKGSMMEKAPVTEVEAIEKSNPVSEDIEQKGSMKKSDSSEWGVANSARAIIKATQEGSEISGTVDFVETGDGVQVVASLENVTPAGKHGIHIHAEGSCEEGGKAAGGHFNPVSTQHGLLPKDGHGNAHTGDMGNIEIGESGNGALIVFMPGLSLVKGHKNIAGKAVILHEKEDDFGQPTGNAGSRIGCGVIELNN